MEFITGKRKGYKFLLMNQLEVKIWENEKKETYLHPFGGVVADLVANKAEIPNS